VYGVVTRVAPIRTLRSAKPEEITVSRIGKQPVAIPSGVKVAVEKGVVQVEGPKGKLAQSIHPNIKVESDGKQIKVTRPDDERQNRALHGLTRALINNMVIGVTKGYEKRLKIEGVGFQAASKGKGVELTVGFANRIVHNPPEGINVAVPDPTTIVVSGADKQKVGQFAAEIRASRKPEPYKGKGVRYENEVIRKKEGKSFAAGK
jgi:large subunit ribosomal protein L6